MLATSRTITNTFKHCRKQANLLSSILSEVKEVLEMAKQGKDIDIDEDDEDVDANVSMQHVCMYARMRI